MALAAIFAGRGDWDAAASLAKRANELANPEGNGFGRANGREGAFLEAICLRHIAKNEDDLALSLKLMTLAERIADRERNSIDAALLAPTDNWDIVYERFEAERLACDVTCFYFRRYGRDGSVRVDDVSGAGALVTRLDDLLQRPLTSSLHLPTAWTRSFVLYGRFYLAPLSTS